MQAFAPQKIDRNNRFLQMLAQNNTNNGSVGGGLASVLQQALMGFEAGRQRRLEDKGIEDESAAGRALAEGLRSGGFDGALASLTGLQDNPYAGRFASMLAMEKAKGDSALAQKKAVIDYQAAKGVGGPNTPSSVLEWEYFNKLPEDQKRAYLGMKRAWPQVNLGGSVMFPDPTNPAGAPLANVPVTLKPGETPEVKGAQAKAAAEGKDAAAAPKERAQALSSFNTAVSTLDRLGETAQSLLDAPGLGSITGIRSMIPNMPGGEAANAEAKMTTLRSQIAQTVLQMYRQMSATGGAVGQVSDAEQVLFQNNLAALDQAQSEGEFRKALGQIQAFVKGSKQRLQDAYNREHGGGATASPPASGGIKFLGFE